MSGDDGSQCPASTVDLGVPDGGRVRARRLTDEEGRQFQRDEPESAIGAPLPVELTHRQPYQVDWGAIEDVNEQPACALR
ncbi:MAG TPA: hypothetical protein VG276_27670 [Actinomycetes bacterium]|jgi:hypothetical protein|nr:hypothetical protein [Actinomycetes bacterium]